MNKIDELKWKLGEVQKAFKELKEAGVHEDILVAFIKDKVNCSRKRVREILNAQDEFYKKLMMEVTADAL